MKDNLEDFVSRNRAAFDDKEPSGKVWNHIQSSLKFSNTNIWNSVVLWRAAAVIFMVLSVYLMIPKTQPKQQDIAMKEFTDVEQFYFGQISEKTQLIQEFQPKGTMGE